MSIQCAGSIGVKGRYRAIVHTGHTYDADGNVIKRGEVLRETPFGRNIITDLGFDKWLGRSISGVPYMICGPSNVPPVAGDTIMGDAYGYASQTAGSVEKASNNNSGSGVLYRTIEHTRTFPPGALGVSSVNVSKAGVAVCAGTSLAQIRAGSLLSAGLLVDGLGNPTTISVNPTEYLDIVWEVTIYVPFDDTGTVSITVDGTPTNYTYTVRPQALWLTVVNPGYGWAILQSGAFFFDPVFTPFSSIFLDPNYRTAGVGFASLTATNTTATALAVNMQYTSVSAAAYTNGSKTRTFTAVLAPSQGNPSPTITWMGVPFSGNAGIFQVAFSPGLPKTAAKQLSISFSISLANVP